MTSVPFFLVFFAIVVAFAMLRGGGPERVAAGVYVLALAGSVSVGFLRAPGDFRVIPMGLFLVDTALLIGLIPVATRANRWWPIPTTGCQLVTVLVHVGRLIEPDMIPNSYVFLATIWSWPMVLFLGMGTWAHRRRLAQGIIVPDWKPSSTRHRSSTLSAQQPN